MRVNKTFPRRVFGRGTGPAALCWVVVAASTGGLSACEGCSEKPAVVSAADAGASLSPERAAQVLAKVGDRTITLGDYAAALERMDPFERMRYQTQDRRQALLDEMINVELLAREAKRRGLDRQPETIELVRQFQRDEVLRELRASLPRPEALPASEVARYFESHRAEFFEPERRRAASIALADAALARKVLAQAAQVDADGWRKLVREHDPNGSKSEGDPSEARPALDVPGDLGMLDAPGNDNDKETQGVSAALARAVFEIREVGGIYPELVADAGRFHVVRLVSRVEARQRTVEEVDGSVRTRLLELRQAEAEAALLERLRSSASVSIDETALAEVPAPPAAAGAAGAAAMPARAEAP